MHMTTRSLLLSIASAALGAFATLVFWKPELPVDPERVAPILPTHLHANVPATPAPVRLSSASPIAAPPSDFRTASGAALDAVVHIRTESRAPTPQGWSLFFGTAPTAPIQRGSGSGVILSSEGYIVTNHHVIEGADRIEVGLNDNRNVNATLVGSDPATDIAVLQIDAPDLTAIPWGDSDDVQAAIGVGCGQSIRLDQHGQGSRHRFGQSAGH